MKSTAPRLGVNIDHLATLRQLRGTPYPSLIEAVRIIEVAGAEQITAHLREDRRHIQDQDMVDLREHLRVPLNFEMAQSPGILKIALQIKPDWACLVPEKRREVTTEGGLNLKKNTTQTTKNIEKLKKLGIRVSLFIEPDLKAIRLAKKMGADAVELHTGKFAGLTQLSNPSSKVEREYERELSKIGEAAELSQELGLSTHAGHGLDYQNVRQLIQYVSIREYNIGHSIVCRAAIVGLERAVREMVSAISAP